MKFTLTLLSLLIIMNLVHGQKIIPLYESKIPNSKPATDREQHAVGERGIEIVSAISIPTLTIFLPQTPSKIRSAVIICPGGGYQVNAIKHEGVDIAKKFNAWGIAAFVLKYRIPNDVTMISKEIGPLQDAQRAIEIVRERAESWNIDSTKIGIMGFSAGGHLAATTATHFNEPVIKNHNANLRPDFLILGYPVISFTDSIGHIGSRDNLLGKSPSQEKIRLYSNELQVTAQTPPTFIIHASDDNVVAPANSIVFYERLLKHNVPAELHIYEKGGHGFGMDNPTTEEEWMNSLKNWLVSRGLLTLPARP